ncbi:MAG: hypothetical protein ACI9WC_002796 [Arenicella sp.]
MFLWRSKVDGVNTTESDTKFLKHGNGRIYQRRRTADVVVTFARSRVLLKKLAAEKIVNKALVAVAPLLPRVCANHLLRKIIVCFFECIKVISIIELLQISCAILIGDFLSGFCANELV